MQADLEPAGLYYAYNVPHGGTKPGASRSCPPRHFRNSTRRKFAPRRYYRPMARARRHQRLLSALAFGLLALVAELVGRSLTHRVDLGRHVATPSYAAHGLLPDPAGGREGRDRAAARPAGSGAWSAPARPSGRRCSCSARGPAGRALRVALLAAAVARPSSCSPRRSTSSRPTPRAPQSGRWPLLSPWLHSSALPVFAVLAVLCAIVWGAVRGWLADYEEYAQATVDRALRLVGRGALFTCRGRASSLHSASPHLRAGLREPSASARCLTPRRALIRRVGFARALRRRQLGTQFAPAELHEPAPARSRARWPCSSLGPLTMLAGVVWAFVQPWRVTLLHPHGQGFWWLVVEPPLLVVAVGRRLRGPRVRRSSATSRRASE